MHCMINIVNNSVLYGRNLLSVFQVFFLKGNYITRFIILLDSIFISLRKYTAQYAYMYAHMYVILKRLSKLYLCI